MKARIVLGGLVALALTARMQPIAWGGVSEEARADWFAVDKEVAAVLFEERRDIAEIVGEVMASRPKTGFEAMFKLNVLMRAGMNEAAKEAVVQLGQLCPMLEDHPACRIYYQACDDFENWEVARRLVEVYAERISQLSLENRLLKHWLESGRSVDEIDQWLAEMPAGHDGFWVKERLRFNQLHGRGEKLRRELAEHVRENPMDIEGALVFLDALIYARDGQEDRWDLSWVAGTIQPKLATQAEQIARRLERLRWWEAASWFFKRAITTPMGDAEVERYGSGFQMHMSLDMLRALFGVHAREALAKCLVEMGQGAEAQKWMVEAADIRKEHKLRMNALLAGNVQSASGARAIEQRIQEQEDESQDDPEYWRRRAAYYRGRKEPAKEEEALRKALSLTEPKPLPERRGKGYTDIRSWVLSDYVRFLERQKREAEAVSLLRNELVESPPESESSHRAARLLGYNFYQYVKVDDDLLWMWLGGRTKWEHTEERLLWRMLERADRDEVEGHLSRAEELAEAQDPSRACALGWIMNRMGFAQRSIPLLENAVEAAGDEQLKERAHFALFESYLDTHDWMSAERIFPEARMRLTLEEQGDWYARIAVAAAVMNEKEDAMRIWRVSANANPARVAYVDQLARNGLSEEVAGFYRELAKRLPGSDAPGRAMRILAGR